MIGPKRLYRGGFWYVVEFGVTSDGCGFACTTALCSGWADAKAVRDASVAYWRGRRRTVIIQG